MKALSRTFLTGLATVLPVAATVYVIVWFFGATEAFLGGALRALLGKVYRPGFGLAIGVVLVFLVGLAMRTWVAQRLFAWAEAVLSRVPLVKSIYGAIRDFLAFFSRSGERQGQVVIARLGEMRLVGFLMRRGAAGLPAGLGDETTVMVYLPMSYQLGGYTVVLPQTAIEPVEMSFEEATRFVLTAGVGEFKQKS